jgi:formate hydrogenlyase subunit 3/multisubunit Na+/H+ antiporter MnhD subunit
LPWLGAHLRLDALSAFFLAVVDLGALTASLFALGYGEHESAPERVVPFFPDFLAGISWYSPTTRLRSCCRGNSCRSLHGRS